MESGDLALADERPSTLDTMLREAALERPGHLSERPAPELVRQADGSLRYEGPRFEATVRRDGSVIFEDIRLEVGGPEVVRSAVKDRWLGEEVWFAAHGALRFDFTDELLRLRGDDPLYAERAWFLTVTQDQRAKLAAEAYVDLQRRGLRELRKRFVHVLRDETRPWPERRSGILELVGTVSGDRSGRNARNALERWVAHHVPEGSAVAFSDEELERFNRRQPAGLRFQPYGPRRALATKSRAEADAR